MKKYHYDANQAKAQFYNNYKTDIVKALGLDPDTISKNAMIEYQMKQKFYAEQKEKEIVDVTLKKASDALTQSFLGLNSTDYSNSISQANYNNLKNSLTEKEKEYEKMVEKVRLVPQDGALHNQKATWELLEQMCDNQNSTIEVTRNSLVNEFFQPVHRQEIQDIINDKVKSVESCKKTCQLFDNFFKTKQLEIEKNLQYVSSNSENMVDDNSQLSDNDIELSGNSQNNMD